MFNRKFRLISQAVGLVAVLAVALVVPGATQQSTLKREAIVNALADEIASFVAATGVVLDVERASFFSFERATIAYLPPKEPFVEGYKRFIKKEQKELFLGALYLTEDVMDGTQRVLKQGLYTIKAFYDKAVLINDEGDIAHAVPVTWLEHPDVVAAHADAYQFVQIETSSEGKVFLNGGGGGGILPPPPPPPRLCIRIRFGGCIRILPGVTVCFPVYEIHF